MLIFRLRSVLLVFASYQLLGREGHECLFYCILFAHYVLALTSARGQWRDGNAVLSTVAMVAVGLALVTLKWPPVVLFFLVHHVFSEVYMKESPLLPSRFLLTAAVYLAVLESDPILRSVPPFVFPLAVLVAALYFVAEVLPLKEGKWDLVGWEAVGVACVLVFANAHVSFIDVVFYHLLNWLFYRPRTRNFVNHAALAGAFFVLTPFGGHLFALDYRVLKRTLMLFSYVHIASTFAVSRFNPLFVRKLVAFKGTSGRVTAACP